MPAYQPRRCSATFQQVLRGFLDADGLPLRDVLTAGQIEQAAAEERLQFGAGRDDVYSAAVTLWAFLAQVLSNQKSCVAAVARVLVLLTTLGRRPCSAGTGAYCKAR